MSLPTACLALLSDLHLEAHPDAPIEWDQADALAAVGDLCLGDDSDGTVDRLAASARGRPVFYVPGNHEFEGQSIAGRLRQLRARAQNTPVEVLYNTARDWQGYRILGTTLWSGFDLYGASERHACMAETEKRMHDVHRIWDEAGRPLGVEGLRQEHLRCLSWLTAELARDPEVPKIVLTHFAPASGSIEPHYRGQKLTAYFVNPLEALVARAHLWCHGHTHASFLYSVTRGGGTGWVACNARGFFRQHVLSELPEDAQLHFRLHYSQHIEDGVLCLPENPHYAAPARLMLPFTGPESRRSLGL